MRRLLITKTSFAALSLAFFLVLIPGHARAAGGFDCVCSAVLQHGGANLDDPFCAADSSTCTKFCNHQLLFPSPTPTAGVCQSTAPVVTPVTAPVTAPVSAPVSAPKTAPVAAPAPAPRPPNSGIQLLPPCTKTGDCGITDLLAVFLNLAEYLLGISGAVALGFFVYGGFTYILSRGSSEGIKKGTGILSSATIGIAIIFLSGVLVRFTIQSLTGGTSAIPTIGEPCSSLSVPQKTDPKGDGIWVSIPAGRDGTTIIAEGLHCVARETKADKEGATCTNLNLVLHERKVKNEAGADYEYKCLDVSGSVSSCVRGLCSQLPAQYACCLP